MNPTFVVPKLIGGLGNQLFILAAAMDVAERINRTIVFNETPSNCHNPDDHSLSILFPTIPIQYGISIDGEYSGNMYSYIDITKSIDCTKKAILISGYNQHPSYIPSTFCKFIDNIPNVVPYTNMKNIAFLHVRRTDYVNNPTYRCDTDTYYTKAVSELLILNPVIKVLVISDDVQWSNSYIQTLLAPLLSNDRIMTLDKVYSPTDTLKIMVNCLGGAICANSTFSWWGAYLNKNRPIYMPSPWTMYDTSPSLGLYFDGVKQIHLNF